MSLRQQIPVFLRFAAVGGVFSLSYAVITAGLIGVLGAPPLLTSITVYLCCIPLAFRAQKAFAFRMQAATQFGMPVYAAVQIGSLSIVSFVTSRFVTGMFLIDTMLFFFTAGLAAVISFLVCRFVIFKPRAEQDV